MMYDEFTNRLESLGITEFPSVQDYTDTIEPVYNYHPVFDGNDAKLKAAKLYAAGGLGIFIAMRDLADFAAEREEEFNEKRRRYEAACREFEQAKAEMKEWREMIRTDWRCK